MPLKKPARKSALAGTFENALTFHQQGRLVDAARLYETVLAKRAQDFASLYNLGLVRVDQGRYDEGAGLFRRAIATDPRSAAAHNALGTVLQRLDRPDEAIVAYRAALAIDPRDANALANLGAALGALDRETEALAACDQALAIDPRHSGALANRGNALKALGRLDAARAAYERALAIAPGLPQLYVALADCRRFERDDPYVDAMLALARTADRLPARDRINLHFALGKAHADRGEPDRAFDQLLAGNRLKRASIAYDEAATFAWFERIRAIFTPALMAAHAATGDPSPAPVFVVGMPRSGTTLVEQILASHPRVFGAGEIELVTATVAGLGGSDAAAPRYPEIARRLDAAAFAALGARYVAATRALAQPSNPGAARIVDKMPLNFIHLGLIRLALPNARIVHVRRDPLDTCWSCFAQLFARTGRSADPHELGNQFTYDLGELGRFHRAYAAMMSHWRTLLPAATLLEVRYEDLVADLATQARRLVAHAGLDWDDACLAFHATERAVRTASAVQVRRPLYADAVGRAQPYRHRLGALIEALAPPASDPPPSTTGPTTGPTTAPATGPAPSARPRAAALPCKCCGGRALWFGAADLAKSCLDRDGAVFAPARCPVDYHRCEACGFAFTAFFDDWPPDRLRAEIYNADYVKADPEFVTGKRSEVIADVVDKMCGSLRETIRLFDYGGGTGGLIDRLRSCGFRHVEGGDPFFDAARVDAKQPGRTGTVDLMLSIEVFEHLTAPDAALAAAARLLKPAGAVLFTTVVQPVDIAMLRTGWWYCAPRNGHVSLHTGASLRALAARHGFQIGSFNETMHLAWRGTPAFAAHFIPRLQAL